MTVILVLATIIVFVLIDFVLSGRNATHAAGAAEPSESQVWDPNYVEGFLVPERVQYHAGHGWVAKERKRLARVGVDEFAAALVGKIDRVELPKPGTWLRQGQRAFAFYRGGEKTEILSPTEGEVVEVNAEIAKDVSLLRRDPYGAGWLLVLNVPDEETVSRNLLPAGMVRAWMQDAVERLFALQPQLAGAVAADGGRPAEDLFAALQGVSWKDLTGEFFLTR